ncbi:MAG: hypothetical protein AB7G44_10620 [Bacteroidia bacterium]
MKHIERKFLVQLNEVEFEQLSNNTKLEIVERGKDAKPLDQKYSKDHVGYLKTTKGFAIQAFPHKVNGKIFLIPEPNPTLIYFSSAQNNFRALEKYKNDLLPKIDVQSDISDEIIHDFYNYFGAVSGCVIFLFTSIESFMNSLIKDSHVYRKVQNNRTELYNKSQIEAYISFDEKIKKVIPQLTGIDYLKKHPNIAQHISNLKDFRDNIIHTKSNVETFKYDHIVKRSFGFSYEKTIDAVASYMNGYRKDFIKECNCGKDF